MLSDFILGFIERKRLLELKKATVIIQSQWKMIMQRRLYSSQLTEHKNATIAIQSSIRNYLAQLIYKEMKAQRNQTKLQALTIIQSSISLYCDLSLCFQLQVIF